jgi:hypothetical protein
MLAMAARAIVTASNCGENRGAESSTMNATPSRLFKAQNKYFDVLAGVGGIRFSDSVKKLCVGKTRKYRIFLRPAACGGRNCEFDPKYGLIRITLSMGTGFALLKRMTLENVCSQIKVCADQMNSRYGGMVFNEWVVVSLERNRAKILHYVGPRNDD